MEIIIRGGLIVCCFIWKQYLWVMFCLMFVFLLICLNLHVLHLLWFIRKIIVYVVVIFCIIFQIICLISIALMNLQKIFKKRKCCLKKYVVGRFLDYKMTDENPIMEQVHEYQNVVLEILAEGMVIDDAFHVAALIEKLPPSQKNIRTI